MVIEFKVHVRTLGSIAHSRRATRSYQDLPKKEGEDELREEEQGHT